MVDPKIRPVAPDEWDNVSQPTIDITPPDSPHAKKPKGISKGIKTGFFVLIGLPALILAGCCGAVFQRFLQSRQTHDDIEANSNKPITTAKVTPTEMPVQTPDGWQVTTPTPTGQSSPLPVTPQTDTTLNNDSPQTTTSGKRPTLAGNADSLKTTFFNAEEQSVLRMLLFARDTMPMLKGKGLSYDPKYKSSILRIKNASERAWDNDEFAESISKLALENLEKTPLTAAAYQTEAENYSRLISSTSRNELQGYVAEYKSTSEDRELKRAIKSTIEKEKENYINTLRTQGLSGDALVRKSKLIDAKITIGVMRVVTQALQSTQQVAK